MSTAQIRWKFVIERYGETFTIAAVEHIGVFSMLQSERALGFLSQSEMDSAIRPMRLIVTAFDDDTEVGDIFTWEGVTLQIRSITPLRIRNETLARVLAATSA